MIFCDIYRKDTMGVIASILKKTPQHPGTKVPQQAGVVPQQAGVVPQQAGVVPQNTHCAVLESLVPEGLAMPNDYLDTLGAIRYPVGPCICQLQSTKARHYDTLGFLKPIISSLGIHDLSSFGNSRIYWRNDKEFHIGARLMVNKRNGSQCVDTTNTYIIAVLWDVHVYPLTRPVREKLTRMQSIVPASELDVEHQRIFDTIIANARLVVSLRFDLIIAHCLEASKDMPLSVAQLIAEYANCGNPSPVERALLLRENIERLQTKYQTTKKDRDEFEDKMAFYGDDMSEYADNTADILKKIKEEIDICEREIVNVLS